MAFIGNAESIIDISLGFISWVGQICFLKCDEDVGNCRCGFAQSQEAYDRAVNDLFNTLDMLENHLGRSRYLCGDTLTLVDVCLFTTLIRFDLAYNVLFKCTKRKLLEYPDLHAYMRDIYQVHNYHRFVHLLSHHNICNLLDLFVD